MDSKMQKQFNNNCPYCTKNEKHMSSLIKICQLNVSTLYLLKEQTYKGRCIVVLNWHMTELFDLENEIMHLFAEDVSRAAKAISKAFQPQKINYAVYGDLVPHLHFHLVPKYIDGHCWGKPFDSQPDDKVMLSDTEYQEMITQIKNVL